MPLPVIEAALIATSAGGHLDKAATAELAVRHGEVPLPAIEARLVALIG
jgi:hypothetical protein